jgi:hypothetical protein
MTPPITITDEEIRRLLPEDPEQATELATEMLRGLLGSPPEVKIENRLDWQEGLAESRADLAAGRLVPLEDLERLHSEHPE